MMKFFQPRTSDFPLANEDRHPPCFLVVLETTFNANVPFVSDDHDRELLYTRDVSSEVVIMFLYKLNHDRIEYIHFLCI